MAYENDDDDDDDPEVLAQKAFSVYCDQVLRDAVEKNERLQAQNFNMETAREMLIHMKIFNGRDEILTINLANDAVDSGQTQSDDESDADLIYNVNSSEIEFPYADVPRLTYAISNVLLEDGNGSIHARFAGDVPRLMILPAEQDDDDEEPTVLLVFFACSGVRIFATLSNFAGTIQDVQEMIDSNRFLMQFSMMGMVSAETGHHLFHRSVDNSLDGAMVSLKRFEIKRSFIHDVLLRSCDNESLDETEEQEQDEDEAEADTKDDNDDDDELQVLARANNKHRGLFKAASDRKALKARNTLLQESRDLFQTVTGHNPLDNTVQFQLRLDQGYLETMTSNESPAWVIRPSSGTVTIEFSAITKLRLQLANIPWGSSRGPAFVAQPGFSTEGMFMILNYTPYVEATFQFDESLDHVDGDRLQGGLLRHVQMALLSPQEYQGPHFTMKFFSIHILLSSIKPHLDALGIDYSGSSKKDE